ncbi:MAG: HEPN domain-containing protein [Planctomycetes bacterium]|nr:HEPN domain-containing protein [Planctomycetota bacterium]
MSGTGWSSAGLHLARAREALQAARVLTAAGHHADGVTRAYFAVYHAGCALLASIGRFARTHDGVRALVAEHFVRPGTLGREHGRVLARLAADRGEADYNVAAEFSREDAEQDVQLADAFLAAVDALLARGP